MFVYVKTSSKKKKPKMNAKQRQLQKDWEDLLKKHPARNAKGVVKPVEVVRQNNYHRETERYPSLNSGVGNATKPIHNQKVYTGTAMKGIGTMHKSNAVPIFSEESAIEIARMRRG